MKTDPADNPDTIESALKAIKILRKLIAEMEEAVKKEPFDDAARAAGAAIMMALARCTTGAIPDWALEHIGLRRIPVGDAQTKETHNDDKQTGEKADNPEPPDSGFAA